VKIGARINQAFFQLRATPTPQEFLQSRLITHTQFPGPPMARGFYLHGEPKSRKPGPRTSGASTLTWVDNTISFHFPFGPEVQKKTAGAPREVTVAIRGRILPTDTGPRGWGRKREVRRKGGLGANQSEKTGGAHKKNINQKADPEVFFFALGCKQPPGHRGHVRFGWGGNRGGGQFGRGQPSPLRGTTNNFLPLFKANISQDGN